MNSPASSFSYDQTTCFTASLGGQPVTVVSKPGLSEWDRLTPAALLLGETVPAAPGKNLLVLDCGHGALAAALAQRITPGTLWATDDHIVALEMTTLTAQANEAANLRLISQVDLPSRLRGICSQAVMFLPKGRGLARRRLLQAWQALSTGGAFYLAGANAEGIQSVARDAAGLFGPGSVLGYKKGNRCLRFTKGAPLIPPPDWSSQPGIAPSTWQTLEVRLGEQSLQLHTLPGVFSSDELDPGTQMLLEHLPDLNGETVLDIGCGYGIIGLVAAQKGAAKTTLADSSLLAVACAQENLALHQVANAQVICADLFNFPRPEPYTLILTNPPFHSGAAVDYQIAETLIQQARQALAPGGRLVLVANRFIRYDRLMQEAFGSVTTLAETGKFHVLSATCQP